MARDIAASIGRFSDYFQCELEKIETIQVEFRGRPNHTSSTRLYQKILCATVLDTLSRAAFPDTHGNRQRVLDFIDTYTEWDDRISLPQLQRCLEGSPESKGLLHAETEKRISAWSEGAIIRPDKDPNLADMMHLAVTPSEQKAVRATRYAALFYTYRNHLVHEFREPGYGIEPDDDDTPVP